MYHNVKISAQRSVKLTHNDTSHTPANGQSWRADELAALAVALRAEHGGKATRERAYVLALAAVRTTIERALTPERWELSNAKAFGAWCELLEQLAEGGVYTPEQVAAGRHVCISRVDVPVAVRVKMVAQGRALVA